MTVSPAQARSPYWGQSQTFVSKLGGYKYVTDQYTALLSSLWGMEDQGLRRKDRMVRYPASPQRPPVQMYHQRLHAKRRGTPARRRRLFRPPVLKQGHRRLPALPLSKPKYKYQSYWAAPSLPPPQPTPYQVRMGSTLSPVNTRISHISGSVMDPYAILALLGFLVFLFYIIYNFINNSGDGRSFGESSESIVNLFGDLISDSSSSCSEPSGKLSLT